MGRDDALVVIDAGKVGGRRDSLEVAVFHDDRSSPRPPSVSRTASEYSPR